MQHEESALPREFRAKVNGVDLRVFEWLGEGPPVLFAHAVGFHARCWDSIVRRMPGYHAYAVDLRGHGSSDKPEPPYPWRLFGEDLVALADALDLRQIVGVGHSMGGYAVTYAAVMRPERFGGLVLLDPAIHEPNRQFPPRQGEHPTARRKNDWTSSEEMFQRFKERDPFNTWKPEVLWDYCRYGLVPAPTGLGYVLACPPRIEASMYGIGGDLSLIDKLGVLDFPVHVLRGRDRIGQPGPGQRMLNGTVTWKDLANHMPQGEDYQMVECSHFLPQEAPDAVADHIKQVVAKMRTGGPVSLVEGRTL